LNFAADYPGIMFDMPALNVRHLNETEAVVDP
jgi:hypothetical protein